MKIDYSIRRFYFLASLYFSFSGSVEALTKYAIDDSCSAGGYDVYVRRQLSRVVTIAKFMSLNLGFTGSQGPEENPEHWQQDQYIKDNLKTLMGNAEDVLCVRTLAMETEWAYDFWDRTQQANSLFGGTLHTAGIAGITTRIDKKNAGIYDVVFYCDDSRLGREAGTNLLFDRDASDAVQRDVVIDSDVGTSCTTGGTGAPAYLFWAVNGDASRITFCPWYLEQAMKSVRLQTPSDTGRFSNFIPALLRLYGDDLWSQPGTGLPSIQDFQLFDSMMISALSHMKIFGGRVPTPHQGSPPALPNRELKGVLATWADVVIAALNPDTRYTSGAYVYLMLVIFAYRSGFKVGGNGKLNGYVEIDKPGYDWGTPGQLWATEWQAPSS